MAENKILVQTIDHENENSVLGQDYFASREKQKNSNGSQTARMASFLVKVKPESPPRPLNADTNHHFLYPLNGRPSVVTMLELLYNGVARYDDLSILK